MNALEQYFEETGDNVSKLAERMGRAATTISRPLRGERNVSLDIALDVERVTGGRVTADQFLAICLAAKRAAVAAVPRECAA
ncbi:helix-turn-helix transcriptional regulator [Methylobacterium nodulans]|uniref:Putative plasmid maintenance system antidote protein, XRE family n=1 Tax=Methylobacterium nodulans (strain LMG 21967 / CNCM I-2342 / ORS 2060) TaxID=460265 RepID=B8IIS9_METNO|nr:transcriptional regulator [Methylobacterium nodulans]ACL61724.1 putative plasmid maintenance system antidote protein, XRE family [Methylobacterium nodulans ORS 2060]